MSTSAAATTALLCLVAVGCTCGRPDGVPEPGAAPTDAERAAFVRATNDLGWRVHTRLSPDEVNVVHSPASVQLALAMVEAGAAGESSADLLAVLNGGQPEEGLERAARAVLRGWLVRPEGEGPVVVRSRVFADELSAVRPRFEARLREGFGAGLTSLDFRGDPAGSEVELISWMQEGHPAAPPIRLDEATRLVVVSQIRFEGRWADPFSAGATNEQPFTRADGEVVRVPTMWLSAELPYAEVDGVRCVELPYEDRRFGLLLVRPGAGTGTLHELEPSAERLDLWVGSLEGRSIELSLPRFSLSAQTHELVEPLSELGLARVFDRQRADLSRMLYGDEPLAVGALMQVAQIDVDETGTYAAATTVASVVAASASPETVSVRFDRPFLFVLRDRETGIALFVGRVGDPSR